MLCVCLTFKVMSQIRAHLQVSQSGAGVGAIPRTMSKSTFDYPNNIFQSVGSYALCISYSYINKTNSLDVTDQQRETNFTHHQPLAPQIGQQSMATPRLGYFNILVYQWTILFHWKSTEKTTKKQKISNIVKTAC